MDDPRTSKDAGSGDSRARLTPTLIVRLRAGDEAAAAMLEELYRTPLVRFCFGYLGNADEAEDVVQDVICRVLASDAVPDRFRAWVDTIARNRCLDLLRVRGRRRDDQSLPAHQREVLRLRYTEQLSRAEIAEVLELPESVVKSRLFEGLERLRKHKSIIELQQRPVCRAAPREVRTLIAVR